LGVRIIIEKSKAKPFIIHLSLILQMSYRINTGIPFNTEGRNKKDINQLLIE